MNRATTRASTVNIVSAIAIQLPDLEESPDREHMRLFYRQALYYAMTGESFDGVRAAETGLVNDGDSVAGVGRTPRWRQW